MAISKTIYKNIIYFQLDGTVKFNQPTYMVEKGQREVELALVLSNPASADLIVQITENKSSCQTARG